MGHELKIKVSWDVRTTAAPGFVITGAGHTQRAALEDALAGIQGEVGHLQAQIDAYSAPKAQLEAALAALGPDGGTG